MFEKWLIDLIINVIFEIVLDSPYKLVIGDLCDISFIVIVLNKVFSDKVQASFALKVHINYDVDVFVICVLFHDPLNIVKLLIQSERLK